MDTLSHVFSDEIRHAMGIYLSRKDRQIDEHHVYQAADLDILPYMEQMIGVLALPASGVSGLEHLEKLYAQACDGAACLLFLEHYSNLDLPAFFYLLRRAGGKGADITAALVAIAGVKLSEENPAVAALTSAYTRIVIYPSRSLKAYHGADQATKQPELLKAVAINRASMKTLNELKHQGKIILVFPSGTRYRPWEPDSKKGVREIDSYIKSFDYFCPVAVNGNALLVHQGDMADDYVNHDVLRFTAGPMQSCREFRSNALVGLSEDEDKKQHSVDALMALLETMHEAAETARQRML